MFFDDVMAKLVFVSNGGGGAILLVVHDTQWYFGMKLEKNVRHLILSGHP